MKETQSELLKRGVIVLPEVLEHTVYELFVQALVVERPADEVRVYCRGDGGSSRTAFAVVDLILQHGNVTGVLFGEANSSHVPIWAACQRRYVSRHGAIGLHKVSWDGTRQIDSQYARLLADEFDHTEACVAELLASISNEAPPYWLGIIQDAGSSGVRMIYANELLARGMAQPLTALPRVTPPHSPLGSESDEQAMTEWQQSNPN